MGPKNKLAKQKDRRIPLTVHKRRINCALTKIDSTGKAYTTHKYE